VPDAAFRNPILILAHLYGSPPCGFR
jgi:hypothetical protein